MISSTEIIVRLLLGALFGGVIGYERQVHGRAAGFRTNLIVCMASVLLMITSEYHGYVAGMEASYLRVDPGRIAAGAITGIGFLGAGVILKLGVTIQGLTTAASIWMVAAIGLALGAGLYIPASVSFGLTVFALIALRMIERRMSTVTFRSVTVLSDMTVGEEEVTGAIGKSGAAVHNVDYEKDFVSRSVTYHITVSLRDRGTLRGMSEGISALAGIRKMEIRKG